MNGRLSLAVQYATAANGLPTRAQFRRWLKVAFQDDANITIRVVDEQEGRALNRRYRGKDYATNVLTFDYDDTGSRAARPLSGDVVLCAPIVEREAAAQHKMLLAHYAHLTLHAALHLQGYTHESDRDAAEMEALEIALMLKLRYPDPYRSN